MDEATLTVWVPALSALVGAVIGAGALLLAQHFQWSQERKERVTARSEEAAANILPIVDSLATEFRSYWGQADGPSQEGLYSRFSEINRWSIDIVPNEAREKIRAAADAFYYYSMAMPYGPEEGYTVLSIGYKAAKDAHAVIGAIRRRELTIPATPDLDELAQRIQDFSDQLDDQGN